MSYCSKLLLIVCDTKSLSEKEALAKDNIENRKIEISKINIENKSLSLGWITFLIILVNGVRFSLVDFSIKI